LKRLNRELNDSTHHTVGLQKEVERLKKHAHLTHDASIEELKAEHEAEVLAQLTKYTHNTR
jgi:hypothetical protein